MPCDDDERAMEGVMMCEGGGQSTAEQHAVASVSNNLSALEWLSVKLGYTRMFLIHSALNDLAAASCL